MAQLKVNVWTNTGDYFFLLMSLTYICQIKVKLLKCIVDFTLPVFLIYIRNIL
jgi:hypothetical protein